MRIAGIDSGKMRDSFAFVGIEIKNNNIHVLGVKTWLGRKYIEVENLISKIHDEKPFNYYVVEINNTGEHVFEELKYRHHIPNVIPTFTTTFNTSINYWCRMYFIFIGILVFNTELFGSSIVY